MFTLNKMYQMLVLGLDHKRRGEKEWVTLWIGIHLSQRKEGATIFTPYKRQPISVMFSNKISQHNLSCKIPYKINPVLLMYSTVFVYKEDRPYLPCSV